MTPRLFLQVLSVEARKLMSYRVDFWANAIVSFAAELGVAYFLWLAIFRASGKDSIGGYTFDGMVLYYVLAILIGKLVRGRQRNLSIAQDIYEGTLNRYLIYPAPYAAFKYAEHLGALLPAVIQLAIFGTLSAWILPMPAEIGITPISIGMAALAVVGGSLLAFALRFPVQSVAFWADNVWSLNVMVRFASDLLGGLLLPLAIFPSAAREILEWLPFRFFFSFPVETLLGQIGPAEWLRGMLLLLGWLGVLTWVGRAVWKRGEQVYSGVGI